MPGFTRLASLWRNLLRKDGVEASLDAELASWVEQLADEKVRAGDSLDNFLRDVRLGASSR